MAKSNDVDTFAEYVGCHETISKRNRDVGRIPVLLTTTSSAVIYGYTVTNYREVNDGKINNVMVHDSRLCHRWSDEVSGVFGLADVGPIDWESGSTQISARSIAYDTGECTGVVLVSTRAEKIFNEVLPKGRKK